MNLDFDKVHASQTPFNIISLPLAHYFNKASLDLHDTRERIKNDTSPRTSEDWIALTHIVGEKVELLTYLKCRQDKIFISSHIARSPLIVNFHKKELEEIYNFLDGKLNHLFQNFEINNINNFIHWHSDSLDRFKE